MSARTYGFISDIYGQLRTSSTHKLNIMYRHVVLRLRDALCPVTLVIAIQCVLMYQERET